MDIAVTVYEKMKTNAKGNFTNPNLFQENGGHITKKHRVRFNFIKENNASFQEYFIKFYHKPYDNTSSVTIDKCDYVIRYENIANDYITALEKVGVLNPSPLLVANKTQGKRKNLSDYYTDEIKERATYIFGPFLNKYDYRFPEEWGSVKIPLTSN